LLETKSKIDNITNLVNNVDASIEREKQAKLIKKYKKEKFKAIKFLSVMQKTLGSVKGN
jgi:hypothetical protein